MRAFEYEVTTHPVSDFRELVYFCTASGECAPQEVPTDLARGLEGLLNEKGAAGWELAHLSFSERGIVAVWKREADRRRSP